MSRREEALLHNEGCDNFIIIVSSLNEEQCVAPPAPCDCKWLLQNTSVCGVATGIVLLDIATRLPVGPTALPRTNTGRQNLADRNSASSPFHFKTNRSE